MFKGLGLGVRVSGFAVRGLRFWAVLGFNSGVSSGFVRVVRFDFPLRDLHLPGLQGF